MYQRDWLDELRWGAIILGVLTAVLAQLAITLLVLRPLGLALGWPAVGLVELCIVLGAFVAGWRARSAAVLNGLMAGLISAIISLLATVFRAPAEVNLLSMLFLFATFALMGAAGGLLAGRLQSNHTTR